MQDLDHQPYHALAKARRNRKAFWEALLQKGLCVLQPGGAINTHPQAMIRALRGVGGRGVGALIPVIRT